MEPVRGVIFDLGSTLIRRTGLELEAQKCAALGAWAGSELGYQDTDALRARLLDIRLDGWRRSETEMVEYVVTWALQKAFEGTGLPTDDATLKRAEAAFFRPEVRISRLYPWAHESLDALVALDLRLAMISNATSHQLIVDIAQAHDIARYFDPLVTSAEYGRPKPHEGIFTHVLDAWGLPAADVVMVGDTLGADILGADRVGMRSILVDIEPNPDNPRFADRVRPTARVTSLREIPPIVRRWSGA
ncbi:MAG TPA: HAD family hydrolase [bacterium]|nr:HAD family hydrolase [bacterium]